MFTFGGIRSEMLTGWLTITVILSASANPRRGALTVAPTCRIRGRPDAELILNCGDGRKTGRVQRWHTPFGGLQTPEVHTDDREPVFMNQDGSLVIPNASPLHSGLYYCLLQHTEGTALWPYDLRFDPELADSEQGSSCAAVRVRRSTGFGEEVQVSEGVFAGAVSASVVLTFVLGFSAGALNRNGVLRCLQVASGRLGSCRKRHSRDDSHLYMSTIPPMCEDEADGGSANPDMDQSTSSTNSPPPPAKPRRSFQRHLDQEKAGATYLEGCDDIKVKNRRVERSVEEIEENDEEEVEEEDLAGFCPSEDGGSISGADEPEEVSDGQSQEEKNGGPGEEVSDDATHDGWGEDSAHKGEETERGGESERSCTATEDESSGKNEETTEEGSARRRVIRLYQYDDGGQRFGHLPDTTCDDADPTPKPKQRSLSLTRLNAIMAAASAGPLHHSEDTPRLQMDI